MVGILVSFWDGQFSGAMLVSGRVSIQVATKKTRPAFNLLLTYKPFHMERFRIFQLTVNPLEQLNTRQEVEN